MLRRQAMLYWWPADVDAARHQGPQKLKLDTPWRGDDAASYGQCWVSLSPAPAAGVDRAADSSLIASRTRRSGWTVGGSSQLHPRPGLGRASG